MSIPIRSIPFHVLHDATDKTEAVLFTLKQFVQFPNLIFNNTLIQFVYDHKHLGLTLSNTGNWHKHIENILASAAKVIGIMRKLKFMH